MVHILTSYAYTQKPWVCKTVYRVVTIFQSTVVNVMGVSSFQWSQDTRVIIITITPIIQLIPAFLQELDSVVVEDKFAQFVFPCQQRVRHAAWSAWHLTTPTPLGLCPHPHVQIAFQGSSLFSIFSIDIIILEDRLLDTMTVHTLSTCILIPIVSHMVDTTTTQVVTFF